MCQTSCKTKTCDVSWFQLAIDSWNKSPSSSGPATSWGSMARAWHIALEPVASVNMSVIGACLRRASFELTLAGSCCFFWTLDSIIPLDLEGQLQCLPPPFAWGTIGGAAMSSIIFNALRRAGAAGAEVKRFKAHNWQASWLDSFKGTGLTTCWIYSHLFLGSKPQDMTRDSSGRSHPGHEAHVSWWRSLCRILQQACWSRYFSQANKSKPTHINQPPSPTPIPNSADNSSAAMCLTHST